MFRQILCIVVFMLGVPFMGWQQSGESQVQERPLTAQQGEADQQEDDERALATPVDQAVNLDFLIRFRNSAIDLELNKAFQYLEIDDVDLLAQIKESLQDEIMKSAKRTTEENASGMTPYAGFDTELFEAFARECKKRIPEDKQESLVVFLEREIEFGELEDDNGLSSLMAYLDSQLCLSEKQEQQLRGLFQKEWQSGYNDLAGSILLSGMGVAKNLIDSIAKEEIEAVLSESQYAFLAQLDEQIIHMQLLKRPMEGEGRSLEALEQQYESAMVLKRQEYERLLGVLSEQQKKMLNVAAKGTVSKVVADWQKVFEEIDNSDLPGMDNLPAGNGQSINGEYV